MRLFAAVWPSQQVSATLEQLRAGVASSMHAGAGIRWTRPESWHVTLRFYGNVALEQLPSLIEGVAGAVANSGASAVSGGPATALLGRHAIVVPVEGLDVLAASVRSACPEIGEPVQRSDFRGHLTLARSKSPIPLRKLTGVPVHVEWLADEVTLVESVTRHDGPEYRIIERFRLCVDN